MILQGTKKLTSLNGGRSVSISFPKEWIKHHNLDMSKYIQYYADEICVIIPEGARVNIEDVKKLIKQNNSVEPIAIEENQIVEEQTEHKEE